MKAIYRLSGLETHSLGLLILSSIVRQKVHDSLYSQVSNGSVTPRYCNTTSAEPRGRSEVRIRACYGSGHGSDSARHQCCAHVSSRTSLVERQKSSEAHAHSMLAPSCSYTWAFYERNHGNVMKKTECFTEIMLAEQESEAHAQYKKADFENAESHITLTIFRSTLSDYLYKDTPMTIYKQRMLTSEFAPPP